MAWHDRACAVVGICNHMQPCGDACTCNPRIVLTQLETSGILLLWCDSGRVYSVFRDNRVVIVKFPIGLTRFSDQHESLLLITLMNDVVWVTKTWGTFTQEKKVKGAPPLRDAGRCAIGGNLYLVEACKFLPPALRASRPLQPTRTGPQCCYQPLNTARGITSCSLSQLSLTTSQPCHPSIDCDTAQPPADSAAIVGAILPTTPAHEDSPWKEASATVLVRSEGFEQ
ncbi:hypothetical protein J6590_018468 [Homalodisca vitripennis]|nr:hypothetical protein J6590_018468 [Homalodisca vitripennis]